MNKITINGKAFNVSGKNISVNNNSIIVDGVLVQSDLSGIVEVKFEGDLANIKSHNLKVSDGVNRLIDDGVNDGLIDGVSDGVKVEIIKIVELILTKEGANALDIATKRGKSKPTIERYLRKGNVAGDIDAHNVECGDVGGNVKAHNIECKTINGDAKAKNISKGW